MKTWKKRWKEELSAVTPPLSEEVKNAPIVLSEEKEKGASKEGNNAHAAIITATHAARHAAKRFLWL